MGATASFPISSDEKQFKTIFGELATDANFKKLKGSDGKIAKEQLVEFARSITDCFLTHDWGTDEHGRSNHARVSAMNKALQARGLRTWFDEEEMEGRVRQVMSDGIDSTQCVIVFVTERYIDKVAGKGVEKSKDNCLYEFSYSVRIKGPHKMIAVVMEDRCKDTSSWHGQVGGDLGGSLYVANWDDASFESSVTDLYGKILGIIKKPISERQGGDAAGVSADVADAGGTAGGGPSTTTVSNSKEVTAMLKFLQDVVKVEATSSVLQQYAQLLVDKNIPSEKKLGAMLARNPKLLEEKLGIDDEFDCDAIRAHFSGIVQSPSAAALSSLLIFMISYDSLVFPFPVLCLAEALFCPV